MSPPFRRTTIVSRLVSRITCTSSISCNSILWRIFARSFQPPTAGTLSLPGRLPAALNSTLSPTGLKPDKSLEQLGTTPLRILLKRPENQDLRFRELIDVLFRQIASLSEDFHPEEVSRLESATLITSGATITPIHFDPVIGFFAQVEGDKTYHVYSPDDTSERELERFYIRGVFDIGGVKLTTAQSGARTGVPPPRRTGMHQPQNACHWVETGAARSVSYTFVFQTETTRALGRTRAFNHYQRKFRMRPAAPGVHPFCDSVKAEAMLAVIPLRQRVSRALDKIRRDPQAETLTPPKKPPSGIQRDILNPIEHLFAPSEVWWNNAALSAGPEG